MKHFLVVALTIAYIISTAFLEKGEEGGRVMAGDFLLLGLIMLTGYSAVFRGRLVVPAIHVAILPLFLVFLLGTIFATYPDKAGMELFILLFCFAGSIAIVNLLANLPERWLVRFASWYVIALGLLAFVCLIDFLVMPGLISSRAFGGLQGPFSNTGQAGSFFVVHVSIALALVVGRVIPKNAIHLAGVALLFLALVFTLKRASLAAIVVGILAFIMLMLLSPSVRNKKIALGFLALGGLVAILSTLIFNWALEEVPGLRWRLEYKYAPDALDNFSDSFLSKNIDSAFSAVADRPFVGVGLGNVSGVYQTHEIHSTYLGVLAYGGLLGVLAYIGFIVYLFRGMIIEARYRAETTWGAFLYMLTPLLIGLMVGWGYTYHIRKREFWILMAFVALAIRMSRALRHAGAGAAPIGYSAYQKANFVHGIAKNP